MVTWGVSALSHDAAIAVVDGDRVVFASHSERYSRRKNDAELHPELVAEALGFGEPSTLVWYERPLVKKLRHLRAGQYGFALGGSDLPRRYLRRFPLPPSYRFRAVGHHLSHAAAGFYTSGFDDACVITVDGIGEWDCMTVGTFGPKGHRFHRRTRYPHSLGLLYSAFTRRCGFKPNEEEFIVMGLAGFGRPRHVDAIYDEFVERSDGDYRLKRNVHRGIGDWLPRAAPEDLAASIQAVTEEILVDIARWGRRESGSDNLVLMGGVALNCVANSRIAREAGFARVSIFPNPGDAGSSLGAVAAFLGRPLRWDGPYLGALIDRPYAHRAVLEGLLGGEVVGVANGRAEFGPRALGNRSVLCDPRGPEVKDKVNAIKGREPFRPFAPAVLEEHADAYFDMPVKRSPYMQFVAPCRRPDLFPAITHVDGTSRVQTVSRSANPAFYELIEAFYQRTGCPMLLNTSLNKKGEPLVNSWEDAMNFSAATGIRVF
ncbi:carbamoyltransferase [Streptomyces hoynatensis]|uniref:Carbamoyltransferase n=1 Tax=Streptomyces hoynatensis TaxID=1141874 RepID=A0A3A9Z9B1_9ACTN|nr:carbamoyltransferase C-terminal domain-containing protein [Streptomyces hoynatensis]RKN44900.1 carbamoyltransferase [Streptomyces hoynatensis]